MAIPRILLGALLASSLTLTSTADIQENELVADETVLLQVSPSRAQTRRGQTELRMPASNARGTSRKTGDITDWPEPDDPDREITDGDRQRVQFFKDAVRDRDVDRINATVTWMALLPVRLDVEEGVYDLIFQVLRDYQDDKYQYVQQMAWRGLCGLLLFDVNNTRAPAALDAGLIPAVMRTFKGGPNLRQSQYTACRAISYALYRNPAWSVHFKNAGALQYIDQAIDRFKDGDSICNYPKAMIEGDLKQAAEWKEIELASVQLQKPWATKLTSI